MTAMAVGVAGRRVMPVTSAAAGMTRVVTDMNDRAAVRREIAIAIDRWEDEGGVGESPAQKSATPTLDAEPARCRRKLGFID